MQKITQVRVTVEYLDGDKIIHTAKEVYPFEGENAVINMQIRKPKPEGARNV